MQKTHNIPLYEHGGSSCSFRYTLSPTPDHGLCFHAQSLTFLALREGRGVVGVDNSILTIWNRMILSMHGLPENNLEAGETLFGRSGLSLTDLYGSTLPKITDTIIPSLIASVVPGRVT